MDHSGQLNHAFLALPVEQKVPWRFYAPTLHSGPAVFQMVSAESITRHGALEPQGRWILHPLTDG